jgi:phosphoribosylglycinamide formyltransferase-1
MKKIAIFASGNGSNAENIIHYFKDNNKVSIELVLTNNPQAKVIERSKNLEVPSFTFNRDEFYSSDKVLQELKSKSIDFIVLAGFMWLVPTSLIKQFPNSIINIHPALLPKYGGKGMYGNFVHQAVSEAGEKETGITIHFVNEKYDEGAVIFQKVVEIEAREDYHLIAEKIHALEYEYFPQVIEKTILDV